MAEWTRVCAARALEGRRPLAVRLEELPLVLFRDAQGAPRALLDRCPHRMVPLSMGRVRGDRLVCCYHGWEFDGAGRCCHVPSNLEPTVPKELVPAFDVKEADGFVWVRPSGEDGGGEPA